MSDYRVSNWDELQSLLFADSWQERIGRFRSSSAFRGTKRCEGALTTGIVRMGGSVKQLEKSLLRNFRKYARAGCATLASDWTWLALAQHHGLPTRLLDWTYSPYVALHFVTADTEAYDEDGVVTAVDFVKTNETLPPPLLAIVRESDSFAFTEEMLAEAASSLREFDKLADEPFLTFFEPPSLDERIVNQFALFSLMSSPEASLDDWLGNHPGTAKRIIIPAELKWEIRDKLDQANISERVLFPGLDGLSCWLRRYYSPRNH